MQWLLLFVVCFAMIGYTVSRYQLIPIQDQLIDYYDINDSNYTLLQSLYSWPNGLASILFGILIDKLGLNIMIFVAFIFTMIGNSITIYSAASYHVTDSYLMLCIARTIVGIGNESFNTSLRVFIVKNFDKNRYGLVFAIYSATVSFIQALNSIFMYQVYSISKSILFTLSVPLMIYPICTLPLFIHMIYEYIYAKKKNEETKLIVSSITQHQQFRIYDIFKLPLNYWLLLGVVCFWEISYRSFNNVQISFLHHTYGYNYSLSSTLGSISGFVAMIAKPVFGYITDKYGIKCRLLILGNVIICISHFLFGWVHINIPFTVFNLILFGMSSGCVLPILFSSLPLLVNKNLTGTAYGISTSFRFIAVGIGYFVVGYLIKEQDGTEKYRNVQYFEMIMPMIAIIISCIMLQIDKSNGHKLNKPPSQQRMTSCDDKFEMDYTNVVSDQSLDSQNN